VRESLFCDIFTKGDLVVIVILTEAGAASEQNRQHGVVAAQEQRARPAVANHQTCFLNGLEHFAKTQGFDEFAALWLEGLASVLHDYAVLSKDSMHRHALDLLNESIKGESARAGCDKNHVTRPR
jgi:hypothetical protein